MDKKINVDRLTRHLHRRSATSSLLRQGLCWGNLQGLRSGLITLAAYLSFIFLLTPAWAAAPSKSASHPSEALFIAQIVLLLLVARLLGELMQRLGQPAVMGQLIAGIVLGPSVFGAIWPETQRAIFGDGPEQKAMIEAVSDLGILMLLLLTGMEMDLKLVKRVRRAAASVSAAGIVVPFICGFLLGEFLPQSMLPRPDQRLITSMFLGTALSIASVKIVATVVREMNFLRRKIGMILVASAIVDDTLGWIIIAITSSLASQKLDAMTITKSLAGTGLFLFASFTIGRRVVFSVIRWTNDTFVSEVPVVTAILIVMGTMALITHALGIHTVLGAFIAGILVGESPILTRHINEQLRGLVVGLFMPVFFSLVGLHADLSILKNPSLVALTLAVIAIASIGKFAGAFIGGELANLTHRESLALASGMNARGSTEVIIASVGLSLGVISQDLFTIIVTMALVTTLAMPPMLRWSLSRIALQEEELLRLEREELEAKGFVSNVERLLVAIDDSPNGKLALRLATLIASSRGIATTVLHLGAGSPQKDIQAAIAAAENAPCRAHEQGSRKVHVTLRTEPLLAGSAVTREAQKGYGLLVLGIEKTVGPHGGFDDEIARIAAAHDGPLAVVVARGAHTDSAADGPLNILVPVRGNKVSRRAAELALAVSRMNDAPITALYVLSRVGLGASQRRLRRPTASRYSEEAALKDIVQLADQHGQPIRTALRLDVAPEDAILRQVRVGGYNLIVMGVGRPGGDTLFFGKVATAVLENSACSMLFLAT
ncbi:MAG TPA: cation:proton antiporter [Hyphomicrobiales bacterium]|nr:cation:proton antiporter [Hyphomicrobiales bacterium]